MKKSKYLIISALLVMILAGCGRSNVNIPSDTTGNTANDKNMNDDNLGTDLKDASQSVGDGVSNGVKDLGKSVKDVGDGIANGIDDVTGNNNRK